MNVERLLRLAEHLDGAPEEAFDMNHWATRTPCGTTCCAMGYACSIPEFAAAGLVIDWDELPNHVPPVRVEGVPLYKVNGSFWRGYIATAKFFGIEDMEDVRNLFDPAYYDDDICLDEDDEDDEDRKSWVTPADVADRIRELVRRGAANAEGTPT